MSSPEVFYIHIHGEQRGPYTAPQIDHLLNSGLIAEETLYWREGLEQWLPVTTLVARRKRPNPWIKTVIGIAIALSIAVVMRFFGPTVLMGWREANQHEYTAKGAYWRARDTIRRVALPGGALVEFRDFKHAMVKLMPPEGATAFVRGVVTERNGRDRPAVWKVEMKFNPEAREWSGLSAQEIVEYP